MKRVIQYILATSLLAGTIIGAGIFSLPYVFTRAGITLSFFYLALASFAFIVVHLFYAEIVAKDNASHRFVGYTRNYLGRGAGVLALIMTVLQMFVVLAIYLVLSVSFLQLIFPQFPPIYSVLLFWACGSLAIFLSVKRVALLEALITGGIIAVIAIIFFLAFQKEGGIHMRFSPVHPGYAFLPLAPLLFSLAGRPAIPTMLGYSRIVNNNGVSRRFLRRAIIIGTAIPAIVYAMFVFGIIGLSSQVSQDAISGISSEVRSGLLFAIGILGALSLWSSYLVIGVDVKQILQYDLRFSSHTRSLAVIGIPFAIYFLSNQNFLGLVGIAGGFFLALEGIFIILMWRKSRGQDSEKAVILIPRYAKLCAGVAFCVFLLALLGEVLGMTGVLPKP